MLGTRDKQTQKIKEQLEEKEGIPPPQQRLIYLGKTMQVGRTLTDIILTLHVYPELLPAPVEDHTDAVSGVLCRPDEKTVTELKVEAGSTLHLVLTLRGGAH